MQESGNASWRARTRINRKNSATSPQAGAFCGSRFFDASKRLQLAIYGEYPGQSGRQVGERIRTALDGAGGVVTSGGRVLSVVGTGADLATARVRAYTAVAEIRIDGSQHRTDIAADAAQVRA